MEKKPIKKKIDWSRAYKPETVRKHTRKWLQRRVELGKRENRIVAQREVASFIGLNRLNYGRIERGDAIPRRSTFVKVMEFFDLHDV